MTGADLSLPAYEASTPAERRPSRPLIGLVWPAALLLCFVAVPFALLFRASVAARDPAAYAGSGLSLEGFAQLLQPMIGNTILLSVVLALVVASISIVVAVPVTYSITRMGRRAQIAWLVAFLSTLALSEVLITFAWQIMLSKRAGLSQIAVLLGLLDKPVSLSPGFGGVAACLVYLVLPFNVLTLYPGLSRLDPSLVEAARMQGATPLRAFFEIVLPLIRRPIGSAFAMTMVLTLGAYVSPLVLGGPQNWTIGVVISETAVAGQNLPFAAAISILLLVVSGVLIAAVSRLGRGARA